MRSTISFLLCALAAIAHAGSITLTDLTVNINSETSTISRLEGSCTNQWRDYADALIWDNVGTTTTQYVVTGGLSTSGTNALLVGTTGTWVTNGPGIAVGPYAEVWAPGGLALGGGSGARNAAARVKKSGSIALYDADVDGAGSIGGQGSTVVGDNTFALGINSVYGSRSFAMGHLNSVTNAYLCFIFGDGCSSKANQSILMGSLATNSVNDEGSFVWNGGHRDGGVNIYYGAHGTGTFNVNPSNDLYGFYIGDDSLGDLLAANSATDQDYADTVADHAWYTTTAHASASTVTVSTATFAHIVTNSSAVVLDFSGEFGTGTNATVEVTLVGGTHVPTAVETIVWPDGAPTPDGTMPVAVLFNYNAVVTNVWRGWEL